jgi:hypothetical protein
VLSDRIQNPEEDVSVAKVGGSRYAGGDLSLWRRLTRQDSVRKQSRRAPTAYIKIWTVIIRPMQVKDEAWRRAGHSLRYRDPRTRHRHDLENFRHRVRGHVQCQQCHSLETICGFGTTFSSTRGRIFRLVVRTPGYLGYPPLLTKCVAPSSCRQFSNKPYSALPSFTQCSPSVPRTAP